MTGGGEIGPAGAIPITSRKRPELYRSLIKSKRRFHNVPCFVTSIAFVIVYNDGRPGFNTWPTTIMAAAAAALKPTASALTIRSFESDNHHRLDLSLCSSF